MKRMAMVALAVALAAGLFAVGALGLLRGSAADGPGAGPRPGPSAQGARGTAPSATGVLVGGRSLEGTIASLQARLREEPRDWRSLAALGLAYVQQARVTVDPTWYPKAEKALLGSLAMQAEEQNHDALLGLGALALARHDFAGALSWGERAARLNPHSAQAYGVIGDALLELGRYAEAFDAFQRMVDLRPDLASYARASYALELQGDVPAALGSMRRAFDAAGSGPDAAWAAHHVAELHWSVGRLARAARWYERATQLDPTFMPPAAGLARVAYARGGAKEAVRLLGHVVERFPSPEFVVMLGDLYAAMGKDDLAAAQYDLARAEQALFREGGVNVDLELALFDADHGTDPEGALARARAEYDRRPSVHAADVLAWTLHVNGRDGEAWRYAQEALRLGTRSALFHFHAGMIAAGLDDRDAARRHLAEALSLDPWFSFLHAETARRTLERLGGSSR